MNMHSSPQLMPSPVFGDAARRDFDAAYPEAPRKFRHDLRNSPLLTLEAIAALAEALPEGSAHYNCGNLSIGGEGKRRSAAASIGEAIRHVETSGSWAVLKNLEQAPEYAALLGNMLTELSVLIEPRTGPVLQPEGWIFVSSPDSVTPFHFDPEHNILLQLQGEKEMTVFPAGDTRFAGDRAHEEFHATGAYELDWDETLRDHGTAYILAPGDALLVPVKAPHFVRNGPAPSISLSVTWRSKWSFDEADAREFNRFLRRQGIDPARPNSWPGNNRAKAFSWRILRRLSASRAS